MIFPLKPPFIDDFPCLNNLILIVYPNKNGAEVTHFSAGSGPEASWKKRNPNEAAESNWCS